MKNISMAPRPVDTDTLGLFHQMGETLMTQKYGEHYKSRRKKYNCLALLIRRSEIERYHNQFFGQLVNHARFSSP